MSELIDNRAHRIRTLKEIVRSLHEGTPVEEVKAKLKELVKECDAGEIAAMEQQLMEEGVKADEIMGMCDLHSQVVRDLLVERPHTPVEAGHPVDTFRKENVALGERAAALRKALAQKDLSRGRELHGELSSVEQHYARKENLLFPYLEKHGISGPSKVMWGKDDEVRGLLKKLGEAFDAGIEAVTAAAEPALRQLEEMIHKEEKILLPMSLQTLTEEEWGEIFAQSPEHGWCLVDPGEVYKPPEIGRKEVAEAGAIVFPSGSVTKEQLSAIFATLPVDMTFIDADDRVRFFTEGKDRVFSRPRAIVGRLVQHCHPPSSVDVVERILADFQSGRQDSAEFWIELRGRFVHIRYFAVRDEERAYLGTLEVTQDLTNERRLAGERRLLQYDD
ncbi:MAG: DUF438 domain-containing protein [Planctomycetota bacterium]|jgi:DUF438 domain-containing protein